MPTERTSDAWHQCRCHSERSEAIQRNLLRDKQVRQAHLPWDGIASLAAQHVGNPHLGPYLAEQGGHHGLAAAGFDDMQHLPSTVGQASAASNPAISLPR